MIQHGTSCLEGPLTHQHAWWQRTDVEPVYQPVCEDADKEIRHDLVARVRQAIAEGTYDTPEKMDIALQRLIEDLDA
jgi:hypothetical protein